MNTTQLEVNDEGRLSATRAVLDKDLEEDEFVGFGTVEVEGNVYDKTVYISRGLYQELGSPEQITVKIEPGDRLNGND